MLSKVIIIYFLVGVFITGIIIGVNSNLLNIDSINEFDITIDIVTILASIAIWPVWVCYFIYMIFVKILVIFIAGFINSFRRK